jgi:hypothetical protein
MEQTPATSQPQRVPRSSSRGLGPATFRRRLALAGALAALLTLVAFLIHYPALWAWAWASGYDGPVPVAEQLAFVQTYSGFVGLYVTAALGVFAVQQFSWEFAHRNATPDLRVLLKAGRMEGYVLMTVIVRNDGDVPTSWFTVDVRGIRFLPRSLADPVAAGIMFFYGSDSPKDCMHFWGGENQLGDEFGFTFVSNGRLVAQPGWPIVVCQFTMPANWFLDSPGNYTCRVNVMAAPATNVVSRVALDLPALAPHLRQQSPAGMPVPTSPPSRQRA